MLVCLHGFVPEAVLENLEPMDKPYHMTYKYGGLIQLSNPPSPRVGVRWGFDMNHLYSLATLSDAFLALNVIDIHSIVASAIF